MKIKTYYSELLKYLGISFSFLRKFYRNNKKLALVILAISVFIIIWLGISLLKYSNTKPLEGDLSSWIEQCKNNDLSLGTEIGNCVIENYDINEVKFLDDSKSRYSRTYRPFISFLFGIDITKTKQVEISDDNANGLRYALASKYVEEAEDLRGQKDYREAVNVYKKAIDNLDGLEGSLYKDFLARTYIGLAQTYFLAGEEEFNFPLSKAIDYASESIELAPKEIWSFSELGRFYLLDSSFDLAHDQFDKAIEIGEELIDKKNSTSTESESLDLSAFLKDEETIKKQLADAYALKANTCLQQMLDTLSVSNYKNCFLNNFYRAEELDSKNSRVIKMESVKDSLE